MKLSHWLQKPEKQILYRVHQQKSANKRIDFINEQVLKAGQRTTQRENFHTKWLQLPVYKLTRAT